VFAAWMTNRGDRADGCPAFLGRLLGGRTVLTIWSNEKRRFCDRISRRNFLTVGALGFAGLTLADWVRLRAEAPTSSRPSFKAVIMIVLAGGPSQLDTWDMKPKAPVAIRGPFKPIQTNVPGFEICEHMPLQAKNADQLAVVRSMRFYDEGHNFRQLWTGFPKEVAHRPAFGSIVSGLRSVAGMPAFVNFLEGRAREGSQPDPGYLGVAHRAFVPDARGLTSLSLTPGLTRERLEGRKALLGALDGLRRNLDDARGPVARADVYTAQALEMISTNRARDAFDVSREPEKVRAKYGKATAFLLARRLVEAGIPMITISGAAQVSPYWGWDTHGKAAKSQSELCQVFDQEITTLLGDLRERGLDKDVCVLAWGEMGRTPKIDNEGGRDHWAHSGCALFAGGGLRMGQVIGATNARGERPTTRPYMPQNVLATLYHVLGIDPAMTLPDQNGRPMFLLEDQEKIAELV
jgi:Protein of unknown function (DUF1501)